MKSLEGELFEYAIKFEFSTSNNEAEYEAAIDDVQICQSAHAKRLILITDSQLVINQFSVEYETKDLTIKKYLKKIRQVSAQLERFEIRLVPRAENTMADTLAKLASQRQST